MPNPFIPRDRVHAWSEAIGSDAGDHQSALTRLLRDQRRITRFVEENTESMGPATGQVAVYMIGVIVRMFDLAGGRLRAATWAQVREAEARVGAQVDALLPLDDGLLERARSVPRAQPHILDEALMSLFVREAEEEEEDIDEGEALKIYLLMWVATEVLDGNWKPSRAFEGEETYTYVHIEPTKPEVAEAEAAT